ncbi:Alpha-(1,3)-fucosyltransferase 6 [Echinococcus granulosus]|uniref:Fucosyltransferase n=1 Tax=Echinococcus granulosus TaxID=6210 RepID=A0A068WXB3_ECHGR|nr:Alpha-(1,3)-fucosyltransferase 6 [Echinococcus granulosus]CDS24800.1 alpha13fucosyltransferase [Echinococcus granulosus]
MIPIVLGAFKDDYESSLPPHSYINVDDYKSIHDLANYLLYLDKNDTAYAAYFAWKEHGRFCVSLWSLSTSTLCVCVSDRHHS